MAKEIPISSIDGLKEALDASVQHRYADIATMLASQSEQAVGNLIRVADATADGNVVTGSAYYDYTGAETADLGDYFLISAPESSAVQEGDGITLDGTTVKIGDLDLSNKVTISNPEESGVARTGIKWWLDPAGYAKMQAFEYNGTGTEREVADFSVVIEGGGIRSEIWAFSNVPGNDYMGGISVQDGYIRVGDLFSVGEFGQFKGLKYKQNYPNDIDWDNDLELIPSQRRVNELIAASGGGGGGTGIFEPVQDITALKAIDTTVAGDYPDKWAILVEDEGQFYRLDRDSAVSEALPQIVAPTVGVGRWIQDQKVQLDAKADKDTDAVLGNLAEFDADGNPVDSGVDPDQLVNLADVDLSDISEGESKILLVEKEAGTGNPIFGGAVEQLDKLVAPTFDTLLADTAAWVGDEITITGNNLTGGLGENGQEHQNNGQFYLCISHITGTTTSNGSATWVRNRSNDAIQPDTITQDGLVADELDPSRDAGTIDDGWNLTTNTKVITVRSKVGSWWASSSGYTYFCYAESGSNWYWKRIGDPSAEFIQITDATLIAEIEAHNFGTTPILEPVATEKGKDRQEHYWETTGPVPNLTKCIDDGGTIKWIKLI